MQKRIIKKFDGGYGRIGEIWVEMAVCSLCNNETICIASDGSEGEYGGTYLCCKCVEIECNKGV